MGLMALITTVPVTTLGQAMQALKLPDKLCHLLLFTYRYIYVFEVEFQRLTQAFLVKVSSRIFHGGMPCSTR